MYDYPAHATQAEAVLALLTAHPEGVSQSMFLNYLYRTKRGHQLVTVGIGWEARNRVSELRRTHHIEYDKKSERWFYRGPKVEAGQLLLPVGA